MIDDTHRASLRSWVGSAHMPGTDFPIQNLPFGVFARDAQGPGRVGIAIGTEILDIAEARSVGLFTGEAETAAERCVDGALNALLALGPSAWRSLRAQVSVLLSDDTGAGRRAKGAADRILVSQGKVTMRLPAAIGDYSDFYASIHHATNVGRMFRPDNPLLPNYKYVPIGYHGRASSLVPSGTPVRRPWGQIKTAEAEVPVFAPTRSLDYEAEVGLFVGTGNAQGAPIPLADAEYHMFGFCLVNDWSARDVQSWEYQPLGPFLAKSFATTVSPWVVTRDALAPYRVPAAVRPAGDPAPLPYLALPADHDAGGVDLVLDVWLTSARMRAARNTAIRLSRGHFRDMYWTPAQLLTHHASNGCPLRPGDLLASGTVSGPTPDSLGCLLELTRRGAAPLTLPTGETRAFLADDDEITLRASCERAGFARIGFGDCRGVVAAAT